MKVDIKSYGEICYHRLESPGETNYIFIHGNSLNHETFKEQFGLHLKGDSYFIDLPGHGESYHSEAEEAYSFNWYANFLSAFIKQMSLKHVVLVGHSLGGHISIQSLSQNQDITGIVVFGTPPLGMPPDLASAFHPIAEAGLAYKKDLSSEEAAALATVFSSHHEIQQWYAGMILNTHGDAREKLLNHSMTGQMSDELELLKSSSVKFAVINGTEDASIQKQYLETMALPLTSDQKIHSVQGGHSIQLENPSEFNQTLSKILSSFES